MKKDSTYGWLLEQVGDNKGAFILSVVLALLSVLCGLVPYFIVAEIIAKLLTGVKEIGVYGQLSLWMVFFYFLKCLFHQLSTVLSHKTTFGILANIRKKCTDKLAKMPLGEVLMRQTGALKSVIFERINSVETVLAHIVPEFTSNLVAPLVIAILVFRINWKMGLASLATIPLGLGIYSLMMIGFEKWYSRTLRATKRLNNAATEYIGGIEVIKVFGKTESSYQKFADAAKENAHSFIDWMAHSNIYLNFGWAILPATMLTVLPVGIFELLHGGLTLIEMITIVVYAVASIEPLITVFSYTDDLRQIDAIVAEVRDILDSEELVRPLELAEDKEPKDATIELKDVHFGYQEKEVLHGIDMKINDGEYVALVGPSGSGKSTIAKLIASMWDVKSGEIKIGGTNIKDIPLDMYQDYIAYVSQDNYLFNETIRDNIRIGKTNGVASDEEVEEVAKRSGCHEFIMSLENGYDTVVGSGGGHLSGGERQRISIARAMLKNAPIVILDEATSYADPENEAIIQDSVAKLVKDKTLIVIAHRLSTVNNADHIYCISDGKILEDGKHEELLAKNGLYKKMWDLHVSVKDRGEN